jgi:hypothetical protein
MAASMMVHSCLSTRCPVGIERIDLYMSPSYQPTPFDVIKSLDKRRREYKYVGWIYVLRNRAFKEPLLKIGQSQRPPMMRAHELGTATAVP